MRAREGVHTNVLRQLCQGFVAQLVHYCDRGLECRPVIPSRALYRRVPLAYHHLRGFGEQGCHVTYHPNVQDAFSQLEVERESSASQANFMAPLQPLRYPLV